MVRDQRDVRVALAPRDLVDAHDEEVVEPVGVEPGLHHSFDDAPGGVPVDAHQATQRGLVHGGGQPPDQILEIASETRPAPSEGNAFGAHPMVEAAHPAQIGAHLQTPPAQVEMPPRRGDRPGVVAGLDGELALRAVQLAAPRPDGDHHPGATEHHGADGHPGQVQQALECSVDTHGFGSPRLGLLRSSEPREPSVRVTRMGSGTRSPIVPRRTAAKRTRITRRATGAKTPALQGQPARHPTRTPTFMPEDPILSRSPQVSSSTRR